MLLHSEHLYALSMLFVRHRASFCFRFEDSYSGSNVVIFFFFFRIYATVCKVKTAFSLGLSEVGHFDYYGPYRDSSKLSNFYSDFYRNSSVSALDVEYVEAFGSGIFLFIK